MTSSILATALATVAAVVDPRAERLRAATNPAPAAVERGPVARLHWSHGLAVDDDLGRVVVDTPETPREWSALLAETHAGLLDPAGVVPLANPSPLGRTVGEALRASPSWQTISDAAQAHPLIAREAVTDLADVVLRALRDAGAKETTDTRASAAALERARAALERARAARDAAKTPDEKREALRAEVAARADVERAHAAVQADEGIARRVGETIAGADGMLARIADGVGERVEGMHAFEAALGSGSGVGGALPLPDDLVRSLTKEIAAMLRAVGAIRRALSSGRAARHVRGREGMVGTTTGGLEHVADLTTLAVASLAGRLGVEHAALTRLALVEGRADIVEKGGGIARNGDVVVIVDKSGSMTHEGRETWAGALALAVVLEARADGRNVGVITYDGNVRHALRVDTPASLIEAVKAIAEGSGGDNNEHAALVAASSLLAGMPHGGDPADVLMITDGQWSASNLAGVNLDRARLRGCFIGGVAPVGAGFASAWELRAANTPGADDLAVTIAQTIV